MTHLFFDLGSTLVDETECLRRRILDTTAGTGVSPTAFAKILQAYAARNQDAFSSACRHFGLKKAPWRGDLERLYPGVPELLRGLSEQYVLGVIANQEKGLPERLKRWGIGRYFSLCLGSGDCGLEKPGEAIFLEALRLSGCAPEEAVMLGDRLDNDMLPAMKQGFRTVWVRQGLGGYGNPKALGISPDYVVEDIRDVRELPL